MRIKTTIHRKKEFEAFAKWLAISPLLRLLNEKELVKIGVDDPAELALLKIKTQIEFAEKFNIGPDRLSDWKERDEFWELVDIFEKKWGRNKTPSVLAGFYRKTLKEGDAPRVKLWLQYFKKFTEKQILDVDAKQKLTINLVDFNKEKKQ